MQISLILALIGATTQAVSLTATTTLEGSTGGCDCPCPTLQDCGILIDDGTGTSPGFGTVGFGTDAFSVTTGADNIIVPDILTNSATATNVCGLEVSANKICADNYKFKKFDICGCVKVCEHECASGCEGERLCLDGRYTATQQRLTKIDESSDSGVGNPCTL